MRTTICTAAAIVVALAAPASAGAKKVHTFEGSCELRGTSFFSPPATNFQQPLDVRYGGPGTCSGSLDGRPLSDVPVTTASAFRRVDGSCLRADTTEPGRATLAFPDGTVIAMTVEFHFVGTEGELTYRGERAGTATGHGTFATDRTPPDVTLQCAGEGVREAPLDISLATESALVSSHAGGKRPRTSWR